MKVAVYVRVSTGKQEAENQLRELREYAGKKGWKIQGEYIDIVSGKETTRPGFDELFQNAQQLKVDVVLFWALDRFSRAGALHTLQKLQELDALSVEWESYKEPYFRSAGPFKDVVVSIMATLAKIERQRISERTKAGLRTAKARGKTLGRPRVSKRKRNAMLRSFREGESLSFVAEKHGVSYSTARRVCKI